MIGFNNSKNDTKSPNVNTLSNSLKDPLKINVLVYNGEGTSTEILKQTVITLQSFLTPYYVVSQIDSKALINDPWPNTTAMLVIPGGADLPFCKELNGPGNSKISDYVRRGGKYLGICAGGYYGGSRCEWEVGTKLEVSGSRELQFFPGIVRGCVYPGFEYNTENGLYPARMKVNRNLLKDVEDFSCYYNGGGVFVDADQYPNVNILANYGPEEMSVSPGNGTSGVRAAIVHCKVGRGIAVLIGPHPEVTPSYQYVEKSNNPLKYKEIIKELKEENYRRLEFMKSLFEYMNLKVQSNFQDINGLPKITPLKLTSQSSSALQTLIDKFSEKIGFKGIKHDVLVGDEDTFLFVDTENDKNYKFGSVELNSKQILLPKQTDHDKEEEEDIDPSDMTKVVEAFFHSLPPPESTPYFNHQLFYDSLLDYRDKTRCKGDYGSILLYGQVITSTSTILEKNYNVLKQLPEGFTCVGSIQLSGKGRGGNVWATPLGVLPLSGIIRMKPEEFNVAPLGFVLYIGSLAMVEAIKGYGTGYEDMPIRLKWPNDIYAMNPSFMGTNGIDVGQAKSDKNYFKIGGFMVKMCLLDNVYVLTYGIGVNVSNSAPTTSINLILKALNTIRKQNNPNCKELEDYKIEKLLAIYLVIFEKYMKEFRNYGFDQFKEQYYSTWLHTNQIVHLREYDNAKAKIIGISEDGFLLCEGVTRSEASTGVKYTLHTDGNSFDMFEGLIRRKYK